MWPSTVQSYGFMESWEGYTSLADFQTSDHINMKMFS